MELLENLGFGFTFVLGWQPLLIVIVGVVI